MSLGLFETAFARRTSSIVMTMSVLLVVVSACVRFVSVAANQLHAPYDLCYEGPQIKTIQLLRDGINPYSPAIYNGPPFAMTFYTPLFHATVALLPKSHNMFFVGRLVSLSCMASAGLCILTFSRTKGLPWGLLICAVFFLFWPVSSNAAFVKTDTLAMALSAGSIALIQRRNAFWSVFCAAVLSTVAIMSKQSYVAGLLAGIVFLSITDLRLGLLFGGTAAMLLVGLAAAGHFFLGQGLWVSLGGHASHSMSFSGGISVLVSGGSQPLVVAMLVAALCFLVGRFRRSQAEAFNVITTPAAWYCVFATGVLCATVWKEGASVNYLLEPFLALCMTVAWMPARPVTNTSRWQLALISVAFAVCALWELLYAPAAAFDMTRMWRISNERVARERYAAIAERVGVEPTLLNLASARLTAELPGEVNLSDPLYQLLMYDAKAISIEPLIRSVMDQHFDAIVAAPEIVDRFAETPGPVGKLLLVVAGNYQPAGVFNDIMLLVPRNDGQGGSALNRRPKTTALPSSAQGSVFGVPFPGELLDLNE